MKPLAHYFSRLPKPLGMGLLPYFRYTNLVRNQEIGMLLEWLKEPRGLKILDAGCEEGVHTLFLAQREASLTGVDLSYGYIAIARELTERLGLRADHLVCDLAHVPLREGYFDWVICNSVLEHVDEDILALEEMRRVLKPQGALFLTVDCEDRLLIINFLDRLPRWCKKVLLKRDISSAPRVEDGLRVHMAKAYGVRRRYRGEELTGRLRGLGFEVLEEKYYLTRLGGMLFELLHCIRGIDISTGLGRLLFNVLSLSVAPLLIISGDISFTPGPGLELVAIKG